MSDSNHNQYSAAELKKLNQQFKNSLKQSTISIFEKEIFPILKTAAQNGNISIELNNPTYKQFEEFLRIIINAKQKIDINDLISYMVEQGFNVYYAIDKDLNSHIRKISWGHFDKSKAYKIDDDYLNQRKGCATLT